MVIALPVQVGAARSSGSRIRLNDQRAIPRFKAKSLASCPSTTENTILQAQEAAFRKTNASWQQPIPD
jgi:hypothetical protein